MSNAVYHRSYQINEPITVRITSEQIEITSFPGFDRTITNEQIAAGDIRSRMYRNRRIGDFLKELKLIEGRNTGFPNAKRALELNDSPVLEFQMNPERDYLNVIIHVQREFIQVNPVSEYEMRIIAILSESPCTLTELSHKMGYKGITAKLSKTVEMLLARRKLVRILIDSDVKLGVVK